MASDKPKTLQQIIQYFSDEKVCVGAVAKMRWPDGPCCPACESKEPYWLETQKRWKCRACRRQFSVKLGTIFEDSPIPLQKWLPALWMLVNCRNGISSYEIARDLGISQKSAWFVLHRLRLVLQSGSVEKLGGKGGEIEADETYVGGKVKNMHKSRQAEWRKARESNMHGSGWLIGKSAVMGILDRKQRKIRATVIPAINREVLQGEILKNVAHGTKVYTDEHKAYRSLPKDYVHQFVNHLEGYVDGKVTTNGIENFWSCLKRGLNGTYVAVEPFHLFRYVDEQAFRFNNRKDETGRKLTDEERFNLALSQVAGKRLTFAEVIGKDDATRMPAPL